MSSYYVTRPGKNPSCHSEHQVRIKYGCRYLNGLDDSAVNQLCETVPGHRIPDLECNVLPAPPRMELLGGTVVREIAVRKCGPGPSRNVVGRYKSFGWVPSVGCGLGGTGGQQRSAASNLGTWVPGYLGIWVHVSYVVLNPACLEPARYFKLAGAESSRDINQLSPNERRPSMLGTREVL